MMIAIGMMAFLPLWSQKKLAVTDMAQVLTPGCESSLQARLLKDSIELTTLIDTRNKCNYWFASLEKKPDGIQLKISDCQEKTAGVKNMGSMLASASDEDKAMLLYYAVMEILRNPYANVPSANTAVTNSGTGEQQQVATETDPGEHKSRYFFAPSAYTIEKGELYYNSLYFVVHDVQYGIDDHFSLGMGTTIFAFPFYLTPKFSISVNEKSAFAIGDMLMLGTWGSKFTGNLLYANYTAGGIYNNVTLGGGYLYVGGKNIHEKTNSFVGNLNALGKLSGHIYFITENYATGFNSMESASYYDPVTYTSSYADFSRKVFIIYGLTGFRFINRTKDVISIQVGLSYIYTAYGDTPIKYTGPNWSVSSNGGGLIAFPVIGFSRKFAAKY